MVEVFVAQNPDRSRPSRPAQIGLRPSSSRTTDRKAKAPGKNRGPDICVLSRGLVAPAELVVQTGAPDVVLELNLARCDVADAEGTSRERGKVVELDVEKFAFGRPAVAKRVFEAAAHRPTAAGIALLMAGTKRTAGEKFRRVDLCPRAAASAVHHRLVQDGPAELAARRHEPTLLRLRNEVGAAGEERLERRLECLAFFIGRGAVGFDTEDQHAPLPVAADLAPADEAGQVEAVGNGASGHGPTARTSNNGSRRGEMLAGSARITRARTNIAAGPGVDRNGRRRWCRSRPCEFGSHCRRRSQAQRDQRYASEK